MKAFNLLPPELRGTPVISPVAARTREPVTGLGSYAVLAGLALCVAALAVYVLAGNTVADRQAELAAITAQTEETNRQAAALKPYADFQALAAARITTVRALADSRFDWDTALRDLSRALPGDVTLSSIVGTLSPTSGGGGGALRGARQAPALELKGCAESQPRVAALMARLHAIGGVTRVALGRSDKEVNAATGAATTPGATIGGGCGKGNPPGFEIVIFFERYSASPAATVSTAATPPVTPEATPAAAGAAPAASGTPVPATTPEAGTP
jgi:Tfp pilus assembly protein PilN